MDKSDLKKAAFDLALAEVYARVAYEKYQKKVRGYDSKEINKQEDYVSGLKDKVQMIHGQLPELSDKSYWWSIPFDISKPDPENPDTFALARGIYTEQDEVEDYGGFELKQKSHCVYGGDVLRLYLTGRESSQMTLYVNRKELKKHLTDWIDVKYILNCETDILGEIGNLKEYSGVRPGTVEYLRMEQQIQQDMSQIRSVSNILEADLASHEARWDAREMIRHGSIFNNQERYMQGKMSADDYYREELWRDYEQSQLKNKAYEEESRIRHRIEQEQERMRQVRAAYAKTIAENAIRLVNRGNTVRFMNCGKVFYYKDEIMAITINTDIRPVYEAKYLGTLQIDRLEGKISGNRIIMNKVPSPVPLMEFILEQYGPKLKPYNVLSARPSGASDAMWRLWAEKRFIYELYIRELNQRGDKL